jgi:hypothetical protein
LLVLRRRVADSSTAAAVYFVSVLAVLAVGSIWVSGCVLAVVGLIVFTIPVPFTWPLLDAAFTRYMREPNVNAPARTRMHWVAAVLVGMLLSVILGGLAGC